MRPIPASRIGESHGLLRAINQRGRVRLDEFVTEFSANELFPPELDNGLGKTRQYVSYARGLGLVKEDRGTVELTDLGKRYVRAGDDAAPFAVSEAQAEWVRRQLREKHMTDSIFHGLAIGLSLLSSIAPSTRISTLDFGRSLGYLGRAGWDNDNTLQIQGERYVALLQDIGLIDGERTITRTGSAVKSELTLPIHMSLQDIAAQLNPGGAEAVRAEGEADWAARQAAAQPEPEPEGDSAAGAAEAPAAAPPASVAAAPPSAAAPPASSAVEEDEEDEWQDVGPGAARSAAAAMPEEPPPPPPAPTGPPPAPPQPAPAAAPPQPAPAPAQPAPVAAAAPPVPPADAWDVAEPHEPTRAYAAAPPPAPPAAAPPAAAAPPPAATPAPVPAPATPAGSAEVSVRPQDAPTVTTPPTAEAAPAARLAEAPPPAPRAASGFLDAATIRVAAEGQGLLLPAGVYAGIAAALAGGKHVVLTGPPGAGKTTLALAVARAAVTSGRSSGAVLVTAAERWSAGDTLGRRPREDGAPSRAGHVVDAAQRGKWLVIDELERARLDRALGALSTFLAGLPVTLPAGGEARPPEGWRIVATAGRIDSASPALLRRFARVTVPSPGDAELEWLIGAAAGDDPTATAAARSLLVLREVRALGAGVFLDAARHAAERNAIESSDQRTLAREAYTAYVEPLMTGLDDRAQVRLKELLGGL